MSYRKIKRGTNKQSYNLSEFSHINFLITDTKPPSTTLGPVFSIIVVTYLLSVVKTLYNPFLTSRTPTSNSTTTTTPSTKSKIETTVRLLSPFSKSFNH